ncbi:MAG: tetratricopeptide repeat protein [Rhodanobacteraceae bacterium]|nr:MAG: tetratricopeptide repeat protein [Rhodanobacteraceae bacterium]
MTSSFLIIAAIMVVAALACVLVPMLRSAHREGRPRAPFWIALLLVLATPPAVLGAYLSIGTPQALQAAPVDNHATLVDATRQLRQSLTRKPDDAQGWALLAQAYSALNQPQQALDALNHLLRLKPDDPDAMVAWVEATAATDPRHLIDDDARAKLRRALQIDPTHQRALWLLGISDYQRQQYADAAKQWKTLLPLLQPGSKVAATVQQELADAESRAGATNVATASSSAPGSLANTDSVAIQVTVNIQDQMLDKIKPGETLFVFAKAINGPPMPLAVAKLGNVQFPATVTLTDAMAMSPSLRLSQFRKVRVVARLSASGNALPQAGDLQSTPMEVATDTRTPITLTIDRVD